MIYLSNDIKNSIFFKFILYIIYPIFKWFYNVKLKNAENLLNVINENKSVIFISRHTTHNLDLIPGLFLLYTYIKKPVRGLGHKYIKYTLYYLKYIGVVIGTPNNAQELINNNEIIAVMPGGFSEMYIGCQNAYKVNWKSNSGKYRTGFAKLAIDNNIEIIPMAGKNIEEMCFAPLVYLANKLKLTQNYQINNNNNIILNLFIQFIIVLCSAILIIPLPVPITIYIGKPIKKKENESLIEFTQRCENKLQELNYKVNNRYNRDIIKALKERFNN